MFRIEHHTPFYTPLFTMKYDDKKKLRTHNQLKDRAFVLEKENKGRVVSNVGGYQSDSFTTKDNLVNNFYNEILPIVYKITQTYEIAYNYQIILLNLWFNVNRKHNFNHPHVHNACNFSGIYYLNVPKNSGVLRFNNPDKIIQNFPFYEGPFHNHNGSNNSQFLISPEEGLLVIFPSHLEHSVEPNQNDDPRVSIAFNIKINKVENNESQSR
mgnify:CR=1 FL=1